MIYNMFTQKNMFSRLEASDSLRVAFAPVAQLNGLINKAHMENAVKNGENLTFFQVIRGRYE